VRDLLAITRALYRAELAASPTPEAAAPAATVSAATVSAATVSDTAGRLRRLEEIGHMLRQALELSRVEPDTIGHRAAWTWADQGTTALGELVATTEAKLEPLVRAAADKLRTG
jgi:hypothetical protein